MDAQVNFQSVVRPLLDRYRHTSLAARWEDVIALDPDPKPLAFWMRDSDDLVNIVWLTPHDVRDITWYPQTQRSTLNILPLHVFSGIEVLEGAEAAKISGVGVAGYLVIDVRATFTGNGLIWVANSEKEATELRRFVTQFLKTALETSKCLANP